MLYIYNKNIVTLSISIIWNAMAVPLSVQQLANFSNWIFVFWNNLMEFNKFSIHCYIWKHMPTFFYSITFSKIDITIVTVKIVWNTIFIYLLTFNYLLTLSYT